MNKSDLSTHANQFSYNMMAEGEYAKLAPHLSHSSIRSRYAALISRVMAAASRNGITPTVLDLGAGDGLATLPFLALGARVVAVDISRQQLDQLEERCKTYGDHLEVRCADITKVLCQGAIYDVVVINSVLHHIPDYLGLLEQVPGVLGKRGILFSFQDPMWKASMTLRDSFLSGAAYAAWRMGRGDVFGGLWRRVRREFGVFKADSLHDNTEYHAIRGGVNQLAISQLLANHGMRCELTEYCSFHSALLQPVGDRLGVRNTFAITASRDASVFSLGSLHGDSTIV